MVIETFPSVLIAAVTDEMPYFLVNKWRETIGIPLEQVEVPLKVMKVLPRVNIRCWRPNCFKSYNGANKNRIM